MNVTELVDAKIKTRRVSELSLTADQLVELIQKRYPEMLVAPRSGVELDAVYGCGKLCHLKVKWSEPDNEAATDTPRTTTTIRINGKRFFISRDFVTFDEVTDLARQPDFASVTYSNGVGGHSGILSKGGMVGITDGMIFDAVVTGNA